MSLTLRINSTPNEMTSPNHKVKIRKIKTFISFYALLGENMDNVAPQNAVKNLNKFSFPVLPFFILDVLLLPWGKGLQS